jgi:hypothetical protein
MRVTWAKDWRLGRCGCGERCGHYRLGPLNIWIVGLAR